MEFVLWTPVFAALIAGATDISLVFMNQSNYWNVARDTARIVSRHAMTPAEAEAYAESNAIFGSGAPNADLTCEPDPDCSIGNPEYVIVTVAAPASSIDAFGLFGIFKNTTIKAQVRHKIEPQ